MNQISEVENIRKLVKSFATKEIPAYKSQEISVELLLKLFNRFSSLGLTGLRVSTEYGGSGASNEMVATVMEELAAIDLGVAIFLSVHNMVCGLITNSGNKQQKDLYLKDLASGKQLAAFALTEPTAGSDAANIKATAKLFHDHYILNGDKCYITSANVANIFLVSAKVEDQISAFIVPANTPGIIVSPADKKMGAELSPIASIAFKNVSIKKENLLGAIGDGYRLALSTLTSGRVNIAACAVGIAKAAIEIAVNHLNEREQFNQKLINFQGLQFMLADMEMKREASELLTYKAARLIDEGAPSSKSRKAAAIAKCYASDAAMSITTDAVQLLGGAGYLYDYKVEGLMRAAKMLQIVEGTNQIQRIIIAREFIK